MKRNLINTVSLEYGVFIKTENPLHTPNISCYLSNLKNVVNLYCDNSLYV
jgi:hypothetical protein